MTITDDDVAANTKPVFNLTVPSLSPGAWLLIGSGGFSSSYSDADGDVATKYEIKASEEGHRFWVPSVPGFYAVGGQEIRVEDLGYLYVKGHGSNEDGIRC